MSAPDILTTEPTAADAQRCAEYLVEAGVETFMGLTTERRSGWAQSGSVHSREVLVLAAEVVELRARVAALEAERDELREWLANRNVELEGAASLAADVSALRGLYDEECELTRVWMRRHSHGVLRLMRATRRVKKLTTERSVLRARLAAMSDRIAVMDYDREALRADLATLRPRVAALEAERDDLLGTVDTLTAGLEAHAAGLSALSATIERACEEAAEPEPEVERAPCEECANYWRCAMEGMADATQRDCAFPESRFEPIGGAA